MEREIDFYQNMNGDYVKLAILIAEKTIEASDKLLILAPADQLSDLSNKLWSEKKESFFAHGLLDEDLSDYAPIWLSSKVEDNPIHADTVMLTNGLGIENLTKFKHIFYLFNGSSEKELELARLHWRDWSSGPKHVCRYFSQIASDRWQQQK